MQLPGLRTKPAERPGKTKALSEVKIAGQKVLEQDIEDLEVYSSLDQPDKCAITLTVSGVQNHGARIKVTDDIQVKLAHERDELDTAFIGEINGLTPIAANAGRKGGMLVVRGVNALHSLMRGKRSVTYQGEGNGITDKDIIDVILARNSALKLTADFGNDEPKIRYQHVYQHNQTDLEFIRHRAGRIGYQVLIRDSKLLFRKRNTEVSGLKLVLRAERQTGDDKGVIALESFVPQISGGNQVSEVRVRCYQPDQRRELVCIAKVGGPNSPPKLAGETGTEATAAKYSDAPLVRNDIPFSSKEEGDAIALSILNERLMSYVTGRGEVPGDPRIKPGIVVEIDANDERSKGKYLIEGVRHWYRHTGDDADTRFTTEFFARRDSSEKPGGGGGAPPA